jgi:hypothetical protein
MCVSSALIFTILARVETAYSEILYVGLSTLPTGIAHHVIQDTMWVEETVSLYGVKQTKTVFRV